MTLADRLLSAGLGTIADVAPIVLILLIFQGLVLRRPPPNPRRIAIGFAYVVVGLTLFIVGLEEALFPIGRTMAAQLTAPEFLGHERHWTGYFWVYAFAAAIGFATAIAEPALIAVARKVHAVSGGAIPVLGLRVVVATGVALGVSLGAVRIVTGTPLPVFIIAAYAVLMLQTFWAPRRIIPIAYDSGGVTTSTVTVPVVTALGLGLAAAVPGRSPLIDGFGLIASACLFPIMAVLAYAVLADRRARRQSRGAGKGAL